MSATNLLDHSVWQRDTLTGGGQGVGQGSIPILFSTISPGTLSVRISSGGASRGDLQAEYQITVTASGTNQTVPISGIDARLGFFYVDVKDSTGTWQNGSTLTSMGDVTLGFGQSLMGGFFQTNETALNTALSTGTASASIPVTAPNANTRIIATSDSYSPGSITGVVWSLPADGDYHVGIRQGAGAALYLHWLAVLNGCNQGLVAHGYSGAYQSTFQVAPTGTNNSNFQQLNRLMGLIGYKWRYQFWWQGHADSDSSVYNYDADMDFREFGTGGYSSLNLFPRASVTRIVNTIPNLFLGPYYYGPMHNALLIRNKGKAWCAAKNDGTNLNGIYVEMPGLSEPGDPHPGQYGNIEATKCILRAITSDNLGPKLLSATRDGSNPNDLILTFQQTGTDFQLTGNWWKRVAVYISGSTMNYIGCSTGSKINTTQLRVTMRTPVGGGTWGDADAFDIIMGAPWDGDLSSDPSGDMIRDDRTDSYDTSKGRPFQTGTVPITAAALNSGGTHTATANYPGMSILNKTGFVAPYSIHDLTMTSAAYDTVEHKTGFGFPLIGGHGTTLQNQVALNGHGTLSSAPPLTLVGRFKAPTAGSGNRTVFNWGNSAIGYSNARKLFASGNGSGTASMATACTVGSVYWFAFVLTTTGVRLYTCIEGGSVVMASALAPTSKYSMCNAFAIISAATTADFFGNGDGSIFDIGVFATDQLYTGGSGSFSPPSTPLTGSEPNLIFACPFTKQNDPSLTGIQADLVRAP